MAAGMSESSAKTSPIAYLPGNAPRALRRRRRGAVGYPSGNVTFLLHAEELRSDVGRMSVSEMRVMRGEGCPGFAPRMRSTCFSQRSICNE